MKKILILFFVMFWSLWSASLWADPPVISGNGFSCTKSQLLVTCEGQFPGMTGTIGASGNYGIQIIYESPGAVKTRNIFDSTTGCLMQISINVMGMPFQAFVKNISGASQTFSLPAQQLPAYQFCKS